MGQPVVKGSFDDGWLKGYSFFFRLKMIPFFKGPGDLLVQLPYSLLGVNQLVFYAIKVIRVGHPVQCAGKSLQAYHCVMF